MNSKERQKKKFQKELKNNKPKTHIVLDVRLTKKKKNVSLNNFLNGKNNAPLYTQFLISWMPQGGHWERGQLIQERFPCGTLMVQWLILKEKIQ